MDRLFLTSSATALAFFALASPAWAAWVWPLNGQVITPYANASDPYAGGQHRGIDIAGETGQPVVAAAGGSVRFAGTAGSSGVTVSIRTTDGYDTSYLHLSSASVAEGATVAAGERIGLVGTSGTRSAEQTHLHFGVREAGSRHAYRDPLTLLPALPPAAEGPREAPAPQPGPIPVPLVPAPAPVQTAEGAPAARRRPIPARAPARRRATAGRRVGNRGGAPAEQAVSRAAQAAQATPVPRATPSRSPRRASRLRSAHEREHRSEAQPRAPGLARRAGLDSVSEPAEAGARAVAATPPDRRAVKARPRGPDLGLLLACVGLLGAAALLGLSEDGRAATRRTGRRAAGLLRPLLIRR